MKETVAILSEDTGINYVNTSLKKQSFRSEVYNDHRTSIRLRSTLLLYSYFFFLNSYEVFIFLNSLGKKKAKHSVPKLRTRCARVDINHDDKTAPHISGAAPHA